MEQTFKRGFDFIRNNLTIISSLLLIFVVVGALFLNSYITVSRFQDNLDKTLQTKAVLAEDIIGIAAADYFSDPSVGASTLQTKLTQIQKNDSDVTSIALFTFDSASNSYLPIVQVSQQPQDPQKELVAENARKFALSVDDAFAYLSNEDGVRYWNVAKAVREKDGTVDGILLMKLSLAQSDALVEKTIVQVYLLSIGAIIVVLLLVLNHLSLFAYEIRAKKLEEIDRMKDDFISMASHELKNPLTAIIGYSELLADTFENRDELDTIAAQKYLGNIDISVERLKVLVDDLLDVSRIEQNRLPVDNEVTQVAPIISGIISEMKVLADQKKLELTNTAVGLPSVLADNDRIKQVLINLVSNAIKYTPAGKVEIQGRFDEKWVYITVADSGLGISREGMEQLFSKFYRVRTTQTLQIAGTGLGLWIAREIAQKMGGTLTVESVEGMGSHFTLKLKKSKK